MPLKHYTYVLQLVFFTCPRQAQAYPEPRKPQGFAGFFMSMAFPGKPIEVGDFVP